MTIDKEFESFLFSQDDGEMYSSAYRRAWQAATEQCQKEIAEKDAMIAEYDRLMSIDDTRIVLLQHNIVELQAREKELVEALRYVNKELIMYGYQYESKDSINVVLNEALANVRGEVK